MKDIVLANRPLTYKDQVLWSLIAQLTPDEIEEATQLIRDLMDDRGRPVPDGRDARPHPEPPVLAD